MYAFNSELEHFPRSWQVLLIFFFHFKVNVNKHVLEAKLSRFCGKTFVVYNVTMLFKLVNSMRDDDDIEKNKNVTLELMFKDKMRLRIMKK